MCNKNLLSLGKISYSTVLAIWRKEKLTATQFFFVKLIHSKVIPCVYQAAARHSLKITEFYAQDF